jgi:hypothetical protein
VVRKNTNAIGIKTAPIEKAFVVAWLSFIFLIIPYCYGVVPAVLAIWIPLTLLYQTSALLQFTTEHIWMTSKAPLTDTVEYAKRCHGRFSGERVPSSELTLGSAREWMGWWCRLMLIHIPVRMSILVGDLPAHDWHHMTSMVKHNATDWSNAIFMRQRAIDNAESAGMEHRELWGIGEMVNYVLDQMSGAQYTPHKIRRDPMEVWETSQLL